MSGSYSEMMKKPPFILSRGIISIKNLSFGLFSPYKVRKGPGTGPLHIFSKRYASIWYSHMFILTIESIWQHFTALGLLKVMFCSFFPLLQVSAHLNNRGARAHPLQVTTLNLMSPSSQINFQHFAKNRMLKASF